MGLHTKWKFKDQLFPSNVQHVVSWQCPDVFLPTPLLSTEILVVVRVGRGTGRDIPGTHLYIHNSQYAKHIQSPTLCYPSVQPPYGFKAPQFTENCLRETNNGKKHINIWFISLNRDLPRRKYTTTSSKHVVYFWEKRVRVKEASFFCSFKWYL